MKTPVVTRFLLVGLVGVAVVFVAQSPVEAQPGRGGGGPGPVEVSVTNSDASAIPVRVVAVPETASGQDSQTTISFTSGLVPGDATQTVDAPQCPAGSEFLVTSLSASRSPLASTDTRPWEVRVRLEQRYAVGPGVPADLVVVGAGRAQGEAALTAGQAVREAGKFDVVLQVEAHVSLRPGFVTAHITGHCGTPYVIPNESILPGQTDRGSYPGGWDLGSSGAL